MNVYVRELSRELGRRGLAVDVYTRWTDRDVPQVVQFGDNARVIHVPAGRIGSLPKAALWPHLPEFVYHIDRYVAARGLGYGLIHSHYWLSGWAGLLLSRRWHVPHAAMFHTLAELKRRARPEERESPERTRVEREVIACADAIVAASAHERTQMVSLYGAEPQRVDVVPCGVDLDLFRPGSPQQARRQLGLGDEPVALYVGRIEPLKGLDLLIRTLPLLPKSVRSRALLLIVGGEREPATPSHNGHIDERTRLANMARELGVAAQVRFTGAVPQAELLWYYRAADVAVLPSYYESFGLAAIEALACGTPVVASMVGGLLTTVADGQSGFLVPWRCPPAFAEKIGALLTDLPLRQRLAGNARASVAAFGWPSVADRVLSVYRHLAALHIPQACLCRAAAPAIISAR
ncbi:MAG: glycosyltransferase [Chloroflexi bacterium]|nr:glycosyltransferase [Chloroflexota bacterium]